jgi:hypothetical protein
VEFVGLLYAEFTPLLALPFRLLLRLGLLARIYLIQHLLVPFQLGWGHHLTKTIFV